MPRCDEAEFLQFALKGDAAAVEYCQIVFRASQILDDLIDGDNVSSLSIVNTFWEIMIDLPKNSFYREHVDTLVPMQQVFLQDWEDASNLEKLGPEDVNIAFVLRDTIGGIVTHAAALVGGREWARSIAIAVRRHIHEDTLDEYKEELSK
jgi:hypothetical protein